MIELKSISKMYEAGGRKLEVLKQVSLNVSAGSSLAIIGPSGSGKSTLLSVLGLLENADSGDYVLDSRSVASLDQRAAARCRNTTIGFVFQAFHLLPQKTALENVALPLLYAGIGESERRKRAYEKLEVLKIERWADHKPHQLSGGQSQRVAIARAMVSEPRIILADEPTGNLDSENARSVMSLLIELNKAMHVTLVVVTHDSGIAAQLDRTVTMLDGRLSELTRPEMHA